MLGNPKSKQHCENISKGSKGKPKARSAIDKMVETRKSRGSYAVPWNAGKMGLQVPWNKGLTKETDSRLVEIGNAISAAKKAKKNNS